MSDEITKTTVYLPAAEYRRLKALAEAEGRSTAELLREAVREYAQKRAAAARPRSIGAFRSGRADLSERADELLNGFGE
ncbi:MAG: CopG family transcriptional regulator [Gemmatimonadota bacterium]